MTFKYHLGKFVPAARVFRKTISFGKPTLRVLLLHHVPASQKKDLQNLCLILSKKFKFIDPITFDQLLSKQIELDVDSIVLSFDDGFSSQIDAAREILNPLGIKALFFIPTGLLECGDVPDQKKFIAQQIFRGRISTEQMPSDLTACTWADVEELLKHGHAVGSHTVTHPVLSELSPAEVISELDQSKAIIKRRLGTEVRHFAYPFGNIVSVNAAVLKSAKSQYAFVHTGVRGCNNLSRHAGIVWRESIDLAQGTGLAEFACEGGFDAYYRAKRKIVSDWLRAEN